MKKYKYLIMLFLLVFNATVSATLVTIDGVGKVTLATEKHSQTVDGQYFSFDFFGVPKSDEKHGLLSFKVRGDYTQGFSNENISIDFINEPLFFPPNNSFSPGTYSVSSSNLIREFNVEDNEWGVTVDINNYFISRLTDDNNIYMRVILSPDVNLGLAGHVSTFDPYIDVTLQYTTAVVPVPMSLWFFASGIIPLLVMRRR